VVVQTVEHRGGELLVPGKDRTPLGKAQVGRDYGCAVLVAIREEVEGQLGPRPFEGDDAELVDDEDLGMAEVVLQARQLVFIAGFQPLSEELGGPPS
jgi:hypothetical protein